MKIITIPDLHGKDTWREVKPEDYDKIVFLGDYVDSKKQISDEKEIENLLDIISLKNKYKDKVTLLLGNHDIQYLFYPHFTCSYINHEIREDLSRIFQENRCSFTAAFQHRNHLWSHAGVSKTWFREYLSEKASSGIPEDLAGFLNTLLETHPELLATVGPARRGHAHAGGIFWADKKETESDFPEEFHQYVGHTRVKEIIRKEQQKGSIHFLDCFNTRIIFLVREFI